MPASTNGNFVKSVSHRDLHIHYFLKPGLFSKENVPSIKADLIRVNESSLKLRYGIFDERFSFEELSEHLLICLMYRNTKPVGFFYNYIIDDKHVHLGLVVASKNRLKEIWGAYIFAILWLRDFLNTDYYATSISAVPSIIEGISVGFPNAFPTERNFHTLPDKYYRRVTEVVFESYVKKFFPSPESLTLDKKRFVLRSEAKEMGFETDIRNMTLARNLSVNLFCNFWIDYSRGEDLIQVMRIDEESVNSIKEHEREFYEKYQASKR
jgi:hypothetical protein